MELRFFFLLIQDKTFGTVWQKWFDSMGIVTFIHPMLYVLPCKLVGEDAK